MFQRKRHRHKPEAELDITAFMNLMIILVPVLLISMVFARITVLDIQLPDIADSEASESDEPPRQLAVVIRESSFEIFFGGEAIAVVTPGSDGEHDFPRLSQSLQDIKRQLQQRDMDRDDILVLSEPDTSYQTLVSTMDTVRSFRAVVAASVVDAVLFPVISLGDAPAQQAGETTP